MPSTRRRRLTDAEYLARVEALAQSVADAALEEGWLSYDGDPPDSTPVQLAVNELARNLRHVHYEGDGCFEALDENPQLGPPGTGTTTAGGASATVAD